MLGGICMFGTSGSILSIRNTDMLVNNGGVSNHSV